MIANAYVILYMYWMIARFTVYILQIILFCLCCTDFQCQLMKNYAVGMMFLLGLGWSWVKLNPTFWTSLSFTVQKVHSSYVHIVKDAILLTCLWYCMSYDAFIWRLCHEAFSIGLLLRPTVKSAACSVAFMSKKHFKNWIIMNPHKILKGTRFLHAD